MFVDSLRNGSVDGLPLGSLLCQTLVRGRAKRFSETCKVHLRLKAPPPAARSVFKMLLMFWLARRTPEKKNTPGAGLALYGLVFFDVSVPIQ